MLSANGGVFQINLGAGTGHFVGWPAHRAEFAHRVMWIAGQNVCYWLRLLKNSVEAGIGS
jgi:hypothetical protein